VVFADRTANRLITSEIPQVNPNQEVGIYPRITQIKDNDALVMSDTQEILTAGVDCQGSRRRHASRQAAKVRQGLRRRTAAYFRAFAPLREIVFRLRRLVQREIERAI
jgi:hypothetical protein